MTTHIVLIRNADLCHELFVPFASWNRDQVNNHFHAFAHGSKTDTNRSCKLAYPNIKLRNNTYPTCPGCCVSAWRAGQTAHHEALHVSRCACKSSGPSQSAPEQLVEYIPVPDLPLYTSRQPANNASIECWRKQDRATKAS